MQSYIFGNFFIILLITAIYSFSSFLFVTNALNKTPDSQNENFNENISDMSPFSQELVKSLSIHLKRVPLSLLKEKVRIQLERAASSLDLPNPEDEVCEINYSDLCPENWVNLGDGESCLSPYDYTGPCKKKVSFRNATSLSKQKFATDCNVKWPCINKCIQDFSQRCPNKWILNDANDCVAPRSYDGRCVRKKNFENYSKEEKKHWGKECDVVWPCYKKNYDLHFLCPINWSNNPDQKSCSAPDSYVGPCPSVLYLFNMTESEKIALMDRCNIEWPTHQNKTVYDLKNTFCPIGWKLSNIQNDVCIAPESYNGPCEKKISFSNFSNEEKYDFAKKCDVQWKSLDQKYQNYELSCPYNWRLVDKEENLCMAPPEYEGACDTIFSFKNYTKEMKAAWAFACGTVFSSGELTDLTEGGKMKRSRKKIYGKIEGETTIPPSIHSGPIGHRGTPYEGQVLNADDGTIYAPSAETWNKSPYEETIQIENITTIPNSDFLVSDEKIKDLMLLKAASDDEQFKATVEETIQQLKKKYRGGQFSFIESGSTKVERGKGVDREIDREIDKEITDIVRNMYENYKIENGNFAYTDVCLEKDYTKCPLGWTRINYKECLAPKSYMRNNNKCPSVLNLGNMVKSVYDVSHDIIFDTIDIEARKQLEKTCNITFPCKECERDYVQINCPLGWTELGNGDCKAPVDYPEYLKKKCGTVVNFAFATPIIKKNWSFLCKANWPCVSACAKNYGAVCPVGYKLVNERKESTGNEEQHVYVCANETWNDPSNQTHEQKTDRNQCHVIEVFNSPILKKEIEQKCKVIWPCLNKCEENFYQSCPYNWLLKDNRCIAPYYYNPPKGCQHFFDVLSFSPIDKSHYSSKCFASWPCKNACQQDYTAQCPTEWKLEKMKKGKQENEELVPLENEKKKEQQRGDISSSGGNGRKREKLVGTRYFCVAPDHYTGPCHRQQDLTDFTFLQKQDFSFRCYVRWPCGHSVYQTENWQNENVYTDTNFKKLKTLRFYDFSYAELYAKHKSSFFKFE